jgi:hypothetical protein
MSSIKLGGGCKLLREHFTKLHTIGDMSIMPIDILPEGLSLKQREEIEDSWILKCNTLYPYGLNARCKAVGVMDATTVVNSSKMIIYSKFPVVKVKRGIRGGNSETADPNIYFNADTFLSSLLENERRDLRNVRTEICKLKKRHLKSLYLRTINLANCTKDLSVSKKQICYFVKDLCWFYLNRMSDNRSKSKSASYIVIEYCNKLIEALNLQKIFRLKEVADVSPFKSDYFGAPVVSYRYSPTIRSKILNYKRDDIAGLEYNSMVCSCSGGGEYVDSHHKHVVTGDLKFITNDNLRRIMEKGLNYRDQTSPSKSKAKDSIKEGLKVYIEKMSRRLHKPEVMFDEWKNKVLEHVQLQLDSKNKYCFNSVLSDGKVLEDLKQLQKDYILIPTDKASNNVTIVCKKFYVGLLNDEVLSSNFQQVDETEEDVVERHRKFLLSMNIKMQDDNKKIPYLYGTAKQHKTPLAFRFITAGNSCSLEQLSINVGICLKSMLKMAKNHSHYVNRFHNRNDYFVIDGHDEILDFISVNNMETGHKSVSTFDFSTLYTSIPHSQLKVNLTKFVERIFEMKEKNFINPNCRTKKAYFSDKKDAIGFSKDMLLKCLFYLVDNAYIIHDGVVYRQVNGIPMGTNSGPHVANVYLHVYEYDYVQILINANDKEKLVKLKDVFRFQDDLISLNDNGIFQEIISFIYPPEMVVSNTNISKCKVSYLDLLISIYQGKFRVKLFDKRVAYKFKVISYPFLDGNIPEKQTYGIFISQLVRFCKVNSTIEGFINDIKDLVNKLVMQGFNIAALRKKFDKFYQGYLDLWGKYGEDIDCDKMRHIFY